MQSGTNIFIYPRRLTWITSECMFCHKCDETSYTYNVASPIDKMGYISCESCRDVAKASVTKWQQDFAYGKANALKDNSDMKVQRTSGEIEAGWALDNPFTAFDETGKIELIHCFNAKKDMGRWCSIDDIIRLNVVEFRI